MTLDVEIWPAGIVVPPGYRLALSVRGRFRNELRACGPFLHDDPRDRPAATYGGRTTLYLGDSFLLLPVIP